MNPIQTREAIERRLRNYIRKTLPVERSLPEFTPKVDAFFDANPLLQDAYMEIVPPYEAGASLKTLADEGVIHEQTAQIFANYFAGNANGNPANFKLHKHQDKAIRQAISQQRNIVVCSGTGSGKTEAFLIPLVDYLVREHAAGSLDSGVRALILYPMNALVNDQIRRLRGVLRYAPHITFGRFIGETPDDHPLSDAFLANARVYEGKFDNAELATGFLSDDDNEVLPNEVTTRKRFLREPAHILVTNYSMLERLLLVPSNSPLFASKWKFIVLDEAHYYSGALGTEIAWLVRRLRRRLESRGCKPDQLRYFATSATLIDNKELNPAQIAEKVSNEFASRIFPASPESFAVQLGEIGDPRRHLGVHQERDYLSLAETTIPDAVVSELCDLSARFPNLLGGGKVADGELRQIVGGLHLLQLTERALGAERWAKFLPGGLPVQDGPLGPNCVTAGDLIKVLRKAADSLRSGMVAEIPDQLTSEIFQGTGILDDVSQPSLECLLDFVVDGVGNLNAKDKWRHYLHDDCDPRPSTFRGDDNIRPNGADPYRNPIGNRLHLLVEWKQVQNGDVRVLTLDGLEYLVSVASELASIIESEENVSFSPASIGIVPSQVVATAMDAFAEQKEELLEVVGKVHSVVLALWNTLLGGAVEGTNRIEQRLAHWLKDDAKLVELRNQLGTCMADWEDADSAKFATVAESIFSEEAQAQQKLSALVDLATVAIPPGQRYPLLDVRYHQLFRGIREAYARPIVGEGGIVDDFEMDASASADYLPLGVCRDCGQPFLLAYSQGHGSPAQNQDLMVSDTKGAGYEYLHAFAWKAGEVSEDDKDDPKQADQNLWLNIVQRKLRHCAHWPGPSWMKVYWHEHPPTATADKEFLSECPNCRSAQSTRTTRFGIITPYQADGPQLRLVALEELARATDASIDPSARANPGEGRKVLAFSDSRAGAASLAAIFQTYSLEKHVIRFIEEAAKQIADLQNHGSLLDAILSQHPHFPSRPPGWTDQMWDNFYNAWRQNVIGSVAADLQSLSIAFVRIATEHGYLRALELEGVAGAELSPAQVAKVWILAAFHKTGRNSIMRRGTLRFESRRAQAGNLGVVGLSHDAVRTLAHEILNHLVPRAQFSGAILNDDSIREIVNGRLSRKISRNAGRKRIRFVTPELRAGLNEIVRRALVASGIDWLVPMRAEIRQVAADNTWVQSFAALEDPLLKELVVRAHDLREDDWIAYLAANAEQLGLPRGNYLTVQRNARTAVRSFFAQRAETVLDQLWDALTAEQDGSRLFIQVGNDEYAINCEDFVFLPATVENHMIAREPDPHEVEEENLATRAVIPLRIEEHTAQINSARGSAYQRGFSKGQINILSCSTTFEMGIDVGDLTCAFLSNLPPGVANYRQRAGRTGRRPGSAAYVLTMIGGSAHDDYFWNHAPELLFGPMSQPVIYLENPVFRARHLRVEALHDFLVWLEDHDGGVPLIKLDGTVEPKYRRSWKRVGDFFVGCKAVFNFQNQQRVVSGRFDPLTKELPAWHQQKRTSLSQYIEGIADVPEVLGYDVADDLLWQLQSQAENQPTVTPYSLEDAENLERFRELGGPKLPSEINGVLVLDTDNPRRMDVETMAKAQFGNIALNGYAEHNQYRLLKEHLVTWVTRNRVAPKYGFPVDVVRLVPNSQDPQGTNVKLERDLKIGLYDYAPDRTVIADKRIYRSVEPICWVASAIGTLLNPEERAVCTGCGEPAWGVDVTQPLPGCSICGVALSKIRFVRPDAFQAAPSRPIGPNIPVDKGTRLHVHSGGLRSNQQVTGMNLQTAESRSGTITYINRGPGFRGWRSANGNYSLLHEVRTDIAAWVPSHFLYRDAGLLHQWMLQAQGSRNRYDYAMASALHALIRAIGLIKHVDTRELGGLVYPLQGYNGEAGFIFFDDSSGGGGVVLDLTLLGNNHPRDVARRDLIVDIVKKAIDLCEGCPECGGGPFHPAELEKMPISREDYENLQVQQREDHRVQQSCYKCLRSYQNQRQHWMFDRLDAATLLRQLMPEMGGPALAPVLPRIPFDDLAAQLPTAGDFDVEGLPGSRHEADTFRVVGPEDELLVDKHILLSPDGMVVVAWINPNQNPMTYRSVTDREVGGVLDRTWVRARML